jgi:hypothetical protein
MAWPCRCTGQRCRPWASEDRGLPALLDTTGWPASLVSATGAPWVCPLCTRSLANRDRTHACRPPRTSTSTSSAENRRYGRRSTPSLRGPPVWERDGVAAVGSHRIAGSDELRGVRRPPAPSGRPCRAHQATEPSSVRPGGGTLGAQRSARIPPVGPGDVDADVRSWLAEATVSAPGPPHRGLIPLRQLRPMWTIRSRGWRNASGGRRQRRRRPAGRRSGSLTRSSQPGHSRRATARFSRPPRCIDRQAPR